MLQEWLRINAKRVHFLLWKIRIRHGLNRPEWKELARHDLA
jgi:hypothetical protein